MVAASLLAAAAPARADDLYAGLFAHDVDSPVSDGGREDGTDVEIGWRSAPIRALAAIGAPSAYAFGSIATGGRTHFLAAGLSWRLGGRLFVRPGIGLAVHDRPDDVVAGGYRVDLGSRVLFEPELGLGYRLDDRLTVEASWVHISHGQLFGRQNPGMDSLGVRLSYALD